MSAIHPFARPPAGLWSRWKALLPAADDVAAMRRSPRRDMVAGVTVAFIALPLALAFGAASGLGAGAGLVTAIVAGVLAAVFGGSNLQVSGPTGAMTVVLLPIVAQFGTSAVFVVGLIAGIVLIALAYARAGRFMQYVPLPVVEGFTLGIAVVIGLQQIPAALGQPTDGEKVAIGAWNAVTNFVEQPDWMAAAITMFVAGAVLLAAWLRPGLPVALPAVAVATVGVVVTGMDVDTIGALPHGLPAPAVPAIPWDHVSALLLPALAVAALAALESLLSASVADAMTVGQRHDPNRELFGQGIANIGASLFGGVPATAAIARTAVNVRTGAQSRLAAITHSAALLVVILVAAAWVSYIPLAALAGVLIATVVQMVEVSNLHSLLRSTRGDALVLAITAIATIAFDLVTAVIAGLVIAGIYSLIQVSKSARLDEIPITTAASADDQRALDRHVVAYRLDGPLFFGAAHRFLMEVAHVSDVRVVILRLSRVHSLDATGARVLADTIKDLQARGITVLLSGIRPDHDHLFRCFGVYAQLADVRHVFATTPDAIAHAAVHAHRANGHAEP